MKQAFPNKKRSVIPSFLNGETARPDSEKPDLNWKAELFKNRDLSCIKISCTNLVRLK